MIKIQNDYGFYEKFGMCNWKNCQMDLVYQLRLGQ